ncbi:hypothetical protein [Bradyrhizobium elkanii]|uniref:hypothetical protein n=1 Tax=Bradyrhizobium elkanii TaxID=29448 RepID=UPI0012FD49B1|nr:hypothetical protein [Bradyrhizobium elkanii]
MPTHYEKALAGRVAAGLLTSASLSELSTRASDEYERLAILNTHTSNWVLVGNIFNAISLANCQNNGSTSTNYTVAKTALAGGFTQI